MKKWKVWLQLKLKLTHDDTYVVSEGHSFEGCVTIEAESMKDAGAKARIQVAEWYKEDNYDYAIKSIEELR